MEGNIEKNLKKTSKVKICGIGVLSPLPPLHWSVFGRFSSPLKTGVIPCGYDKKGTESPAKPQENPYAKVGIIERVEYTQWYTWKCPCSKAYQIIIKTYICIVVERPSILYFLPPLFHLFHPLHHSVEPLQPCKTVSMVFSFWYKAGKLWNHYQRPKKDQETSCNTIKRNKKRH